MKKNKSNVHKCVAVLMMLIKCVCTVQPVQVQAVETYSNLEKVNEYETISDFDVNEDDSSDREELEDDIIGENGYDIENDPIADTLQGKICIQL